jgi:hypothetical protein
VQPRIALCAVALAVAGVVPAGSAAAQACCTPSGGGALGVVDPGRRAVITIETAYEDGFGTVDNDGRFRTLSHAHAADLIFSLAGGVRFGPDARLQLHGAVPLRLQTRRNHGDRSTRAFPGDVSLGARVTLLRDSEEAIEGGRPETFRPTLELIAIGFAPSGRGPEDGTDQTAAGVTGTGSWTLLGGFRLSKFLTVRHVIVLSALAGWRFARDLPEHLPGNRYTPGVDASVRLAWTYVVRHWLHAGVFTSVRIGGVGRLDGEEIPFSRSHRLRFGGYVTWAFAMPEWELTASLSSDGFFPHAGRNVHPFAGIAASLAVTRAFH